MGPWFLELNVEVLVTAIVELKVRVLVTVAKELAEFGGPDYDGPRAS